MMRLKNVTTGLAMAAVLLVSDVAQATFHFMQIQQVIGGVDGDVTAQAVQLRMLLAGQTLLNGQAMLVAHDATGANPVVITVFPAPNPTNSNSCTEILIASDGFAAASSPSVDAAARDYKMDNLIPASYLPAGSLTFEDTIGTVFWRISWGGAGYTGPTIGSITNDDDGDFGAAIAGPLPSAGTDALEFVPACPPGTSTTNQAQYALSAGAGVFTNNGGQSFTVTVPPVPTMSEWGMAVMALLMLSCGTLVVRRVIAPLPG